MKTIAINNKSLERILLDAHLQGLSIGVRPRIKISTCGMTTDKEELIKDAGRIGHDFRRAIKKATR